MRTIVLSILLSFLSLAVSATSRSDVAVRHLTVEGRINPVGVDVENPRLGWQIHTTENDVVQKGYRVQVGVVSGTSEVPNDEKIIWDSGEVTSDQSQWVETDVMVKPNTLYKWRVKVVTNKGKSDWSEWNQWSTGLLSEQNWKGEWIGYDSLTADVKMERHSRIAARHFLKTFSVKKAVKRATAHVCGLGYYILNINGQRIGDYLLAPAPTQYDKAAIYDTYDVTSQRSKVEGPLELRSLATEGTQERSARALLACRSALPLSSSEATERTKGTQEWSIEVVLAGGYYFPMTQNYQTNVRSSYGMPKLLLNLIVEYEDGTSETIATDSTWQVAFDGPIRYANLYDGTLIDYRMKPTHWMPAQIVDAPCRTLRGNAMGGVKAYATESAVGMMNIGHHKYLLDFGTNNTGRVFLPSVTIGKGDTVRIRYSETLKTDGTLYTDNLRSAENTDHFVGNGLPITMTTEFLWHGFRYMEVTGLKEADVQRIQRQLMTDDLLSAATIKVDGGDGMLNKIIDNARRGILSNYKGIPMDCPQRDERMPWLGDRTMGCFGESYLTSNHTLYAKWMQDICDAQRKDGCISDVSPAYWRLYNGNITWPAALPFGLEMLRLQYGDERPMQEHAENVKRFLDYAKGKSGKDGLITYDRYGDWCVPPASLNEVITEDSTRMTDGALLSSCYYYYICKMMGMDDEAETTKTAINRTFLHSVSLGEGREGASYANGTVTANLLPLAMDIVPDSVREAVQESFMRRVKGGNNSQLSIVNPQSGEDPHIDCGVIGISWLMRYLSKAGLGNVAWQIATTKTYPGWGYMVENGATTIWELWNGNTANPSMNSGNHVMMLGDLIPWAFECLAGIAPDPTQPGFKHIIMRPDFSITALNGVAATYPSIYGDISSRWERKEDKLNWIVTIPANTTATLYLPNGKKKQVGSGHHTISLSVDEQQRPPVMGWSSWNTYHVNISDSLIKRQADAMVRTGLKDAGYSYVNIDDGFFGGRDAEGKLQVHPQRFPQGMKVVADYIHSLGLKAGIYSEAGSVTCGSIYDNDSMGIGSGMYGHELDDARLFFSDWGYDFIKIDYCGAKRQHLDEQQQYTRICQAIKEAAKGREVSVNLCRWAFPGAWAADVARSWRISSDIRPRWGSVKGIIEKNLYLSAFCRDAHYNDMDMLEIGRGLEAHEEDTHFALWCIMSSPLLIGCNLETIPERSLRLLTNPELIALNQDTLCLQAYVVQHDGDGYVLVKDIGERRGLTRAVALYNPSDTVCHFSVPLSVLELEGTTTVRELISRQDETPVSTCLEREVPPHSTRVYRLTAQRRLVPAVYEAEWALPIGYDDLDKRKYPVVFQYDERASGRMVVSKLGGSWENRLVFDKVYSDRKGRHHLTIQYVPSPGCGLSVKVNGRMHCMKSLPATGRVTLPVRLDKGYNIIELGNPESLTVDVDKLLIGR